MYILGLLISEIKIIFFSIEPIFQNWEYPFFHLFRFTLLKYKWPSCDLQLTLRSYAHIRTFREFNPLSPRSTLRSMLLNVKKTGIALEVVSYQSTFRQGNPSFFLFISANENIRNILIKDYGILVSL